MMNLGIDMFRSKMEIAMMRDVEKAELRKTDLPWTELDLDSEDGEKLFREHLGKLVRLVNNRLGESRVSAALIIPLSFGYLKRKKVRQLALEAGINYARVGFAAEFAGIAWAATQKNRKNETCLICNVRHHDLEFSIFDFADGMGQSIAMMDSPSSAGWSEETSERVRTRLQTDLKQLLKDAGMYGWHGIAKLLVTGEENSVVDYFLQEITGMVPMRCRYSELKGAASYAAEMAGLQPFKEEALLVGSAPCDIAFAVGEEGEFTTCIQRNHSFPTRKLVDMLVSSEKILHVYEGNYHNRKYDTILRSFDIDFAEEGEVIDCYVNYNSLGEIEVEIRNNDNKLLMKETVL